MAHLTFHVLFPVLQQFDASQAPLMWPAPHTAVCTAMSRPHTVWLSLSQTAREIGSEAGGGDAVKPRVSCRCGQHRTRIPCVVAIPVSKQAAAGEHPHELVPRCLPTLPYHCHLDMVPVSPQTTPYCMTCFSTDVRFELTCAAISLEGIPASQCAGGAVAITAAQRRNLLSVTDSAAAAAAPTA